MEMIEEKTNPLVSIDPSVFQNLRFRKQDIDLGPMIDPNFPESSTGMTVLMYAARNKNMKLLESLASNHKKDLKVDIQNEIGNTALMIAAEEGHIECVKFLCEALNAKLDVTNKYKQTAFILAIEQNQLEIVKFLYRIDPNQINHENAYAKSAIFVASEFAKSDIVNWLLKEVNINPSAKNSRGIAPLMLACAGPMSEDRLKVVDLLISFGADVNDRAGKDSTGDTILHWAASQGHSEIIQRIFDTGKFKYHELINIVSDPKSFGDGNTALMRAVFIGDYDCAEILIQNGASREATNINSASPYHQFDAFKIAWRQGFPKIATKLFMLATINEQTSTRVREYSLIENSNLICYDNDILSDEDISIIAKKLANINNTDHLQDLVHYAGIYEFHFDLFIRIVFPKFASPNIALNKTIDFFFNSLQHRCLSHIEMVSKLVRLASALTVAIEEHPLEEIDLKKRLEVVEQMLVECVGCDAMDDKANILKVLCMKKNAKHYKNDVVQAAQAFLDGPVKVCLDHHITSIFSTANISLFIEKIFWSYLKRSDEAKDHRHFKMPIFQHFLGEPSKESQNIRLFHSNLVHGRYCPAFMLFAEGISKALFLFLIAATSFTVYSPDIQGTSPYLKQSDLENAIYVFLFTLIVYEIGQLCSDTANYIPTDDSIANYLNEVWNTLDLCGLILVLLWIGSKHYTNPNFTGLLPASAVFYACSMLRYLSVHEELGKLVIMIFAMSSDLAVFAIVYLISVTGFTIAIWALFADVTNYQSFIDTFLSLGVVSMGGVDFTVFAGSPYEAIGQTLLFCFTVFTAIILMNLVIARMSATHDRINETSFQEWQYDRAMTTDSFILIEERHPFCMLPAPLNLITIAAAPFHHLQINFFKSQLKNNHNHKKLDIRTHNETEAFLSVAGTASDLVVGATMSFVAPIYELFYYDYQIVRSGKLWNEQEEDIDATKKSRLMRIASMWIELIILNFFFFMIYPIYVAVLIWETFEFKTFIRIQSQGEKDAPLYIVDYAEKDFVSFKTKQIWEKISQSNLLLNLKILRCTDLRDPKDPNRKIENPIVKLRFGKLELQTGESIAGTENPMWPNSVLQIPQNNIPENVQYIDCAIFDRNPVTGEEVEVLVKKELVNLQLLLSNGRLEGAQTLVDEAKDKKFPASKMMVAFSIVRHLDNLNTERKEYVDDDDDDEPEVIHHDVNLDSEGSGGGGGGAVVAPMGKQSSQQLIPHSKDDKIMDQNKILRRFQIHMDVIFTPKDLRRIFAVVDTIKDSDFGRDYKVSCNRAFRLVQLAFDQFLILQDEFNSNQDNLASRDERALSVAIPNQAVAVQSTIQLQTFILAMENFKLSYDKGMKFLEEDVSTNVSGPYVYEMETTRLETILKLNDFKKWIKIFAYCSDKSSQTFHYLEKEHLVTKDDREWSRLERRMRYVHQMTMKDLHKHLINAVPESYLDVPLKIENPITKHCEMKLTEAEDELKGLRSQHQQLLKGQQQQQQQEHI